MEIDPRVQQASVSSQEASRNAQAATLANAQAQLQREQKLFDAGIVSKQDIDTYKTTYENALAQQKALDAQVRQQQAQLHYYNVTAPTAGIVGDIPVHVGDRVTNTTLPTALFFSFLTKWTPPRQAFSLRPTAPIRRVAC